MERLEDVGEKECMITDENNNIEYLILKNNKLFIIPYAFLPYWDSSVT